MIFGKQKFIVKKQCTILARAHAAVVLWI